MEKWLSKFMSQKENSPILVKMKKCYVCGNDIKENPLYVGKGLFRHAVRCAPGTEKFKKYQEPESVSKKGTDTNGVHHI